MSAGLHDAVTTLEAVPLGTHRLARVLQDKVC
jgi:hypothetical protein